MTFQTKDFDTLNQDQVTAIQASAEESISKLLNFSTGSVNLAYVESNSGVVMWLQGLIVKLLAISRLSTSTGNDVDTFLADYGLTRLPASASSGLVTFSRYSSISQAVVYVGTQVTTSDNSIIYEVAADDSNPYFSTTLNAYVIPSGTSNINALVMCTQAGIVGNVSSGVINTFVNPIPYVDSVTNQNAFTNGADSESDDAAKIRFVYYINSLSKATLLAIDSVLYGLQENMLVNVVENTNYDTGDSQPGYFYCVIDDGSGNPPDSLMEAAYNVVYNTRGLTILFDIKRPIIINANISVNIKVSANADQDQVQAEVNSALQQYISTLGIGKTLYYTKIENICYNADSSIINVYNVLLNGATLDLTADGRSRIITGTITINIST